MNVSESFKHPIMMSRSHNNVMPTYARAFTVLPLFLLFLVVCGRAEVRVARIFGDNMVLQRGMHVPVWGTANPGAVVEIKIGDVQASGIASREGKWKVLLPELAAGGPHEMAISGDGELILHNVLIGDVWVASGQSNMKWSLSRSDGGADEIAAAHPDGIRLFTVPNTIARLPQSDLSGGAWQPCSGETLGDFSAVAYYFGKELRREKDVPIGLISCNWGGTPAEAWTSGDMLKSLPDFYERVADIEHNANNWAQDVQANDDRRARRGEIYTSSYKGLDMGVHQTNFDDSGWKLTVVPDWDEDLTGVIWLRKRLDVPKEYKGQRLVLDLGRVQNQVTVYFNGEKIGERTAPDFAVLDVPGQLVRRGENRVVLRVYHSWGKPNMVGPEERMKLRTANGVVVDDLSGTWRYSADIEPQVPEVVNYYQWPTVLYNGMVAPIIPYGIRGVIWYQGESNVGRAQQYVDLFKTMINDWRIAWKQGIFPFLFVQLANYLDPVEEPGESAWAELREAQRMALQLPATGMAVTIDIGEAYDIHPRNKRDVGKRLAMAARHVAYGEDIVYSGPLYKSMQVDNGEVVLHFEQTGNGLVTQGDGLRGFTIAGADRIFHKANAEIAGHKVVVSSEKVVQPVAVRYAWADNPDGNLYNKHGMPASPFKTDSWTRSKAPE
jgi:sialate O-acetylesterase